MLKNVAIPLMLAASEAEAQRAPTKDEIEDALEGDLRKAFAGLQAGAAACTVIASTADDGIATAAQAVSDKKAALELAEQAVEALVGVAGAWGLANAAREQAVAAAVAQEVAENIAPLLDTLDEKAEDERAKAQIFWEAEKLYQAGVRRQTAANTVNDAAVITLGELAEAKDNAAAAVTAAKEQAVKEDLWRQWRYCELGATVANASLPDAAKWWSIFGGVVGSANAAPANCVVPAVMNEAGDAQVREKVTYYTASGADPGLPAETVVAPDEATGLSKWTATVVHAAATAAENATSTMQGETRNKAGEVSWYKGNLTAKTWMEMQRKREQTFYGSVNSARAGAKAVADSASTNNAYTFTSATLGKANGADGSLKVMAAKEALRSASAHATPGSEYQMPAVRGDATAPTTTWSITNAGLDAWQTANANPNEGAAYLWWAQARGVSLALNTWYAAYGVSKPSELTAGSMTVANVQTTNTSDGTCNTASAPGSGTWTNNAANDKAACEDACESASLAAILVSADGNSGQALGDTAVWLSDSSSAWCGGYSYNDSGTASTDKCKLLLGADTPVSSDTDDGNSYCGNFSAMGAWQTKQKAVYDAHQLVTVALWDAMVAAANAQAVLEKAYYEAWLDQQYWAALLVRLTETTSPSDSETFYNQVQTLAGGGTSDNTTVAGAEAATATANTSLLNAEEALANLQADTAAAAATVAALGTRILRADAQIAELNELAADATQWWDSAATGTLDDAAALRLAAWNAYKNDGSVEGEEKGPSVLASEEKAAADLAVQARSAEGVTDGGALTEAMEVARAAWVLAASAAEQAQANLTEALGDADLVALRETVESDTNDWTEQQDILDGLAQAVANEEEQLQEAERAKDAAVLACQIAAYDEYRTALEAEMVQRAADLVTIKALIETQTTPAPGTAGARCEKALSNGTYRPARGEETCAEGLCCGAARVWMDAGFDGTDAAWRTIETCQSEEEGTMYAYQPPRAPMATTMPPKVDYPFTCIEGAKKLAAAASAVAAAVYMLA